jgi:hypothetical protein
MAYHVIGLTRDQFFQTEGIIHDSIGRVLAAESRRTMALALRDQTYNMRTLIDCLTMDALQPGGLPTGYDQYHEIFLFNNPALGLCRAAGMNYPVIGTFEEAICQRDAGSWRGYRFTSAKTIRP